MLHLADQVVKQFPNFAPAHQARGYVLAAAEDVNIRAENEWNALDYALASHRAVKQGGPSFARLTAKIEAVIQLLRQEKGVE